MPWFNVDDGFANSKPVLRIPRRYRCAAIGLWTLAGSWSAKELTDGFIPDHAIEEFSSTPAMAELLVRAGLWRKVVGGWQFEGWSKWQKTKDQVLTFRAAEAERKRLARSKPKPPGGEGVSGVDSGRTDCGVPSGRDAESGLPIPEPTPLPISENLGGDLTLVTREPPTRCPIHVNWVGKVPNCCACGDARKANDAWKAGEFERRRLAREAEKAAAAACPLCDEYGRIEFQDEWGNHTVRDCDHQEAVNA